MRNRSYRLLAFVLAVVLLMCPVKTSAASLNPNSKDISEEIVSLNHNDWIIENLTRPEQEFSDVFKATVPFKPTNVVAKANRNSITVTADLNTAVRVVIIDYSYDREFWWSDRKVYRNVKYKGPVLVTNKAQQKYDWKNNKYSSSGRLTYSQGKTVLYDRKIYHPRDKYGYLEANQHSVNSVRNKIKFRKNFQIQNVWDCRDGYYVKVTYVYTSAIHGKNLTSESVIVRVRNR